MASDDPVIQLPHELFAPAAFAHYEGEHELDVLKNGPDLYTFEGPLRWAVDVTNTGDAFLVTGTVEGDAKTACARCADEAEVPLLGEIEGYFIMDAADAAEDDREEPDEDAAASFGMEETEFEVLPEDNRIDLVPLVTAALLLDMPLVPLCDDDCKGLCPTCGVNLNHETCDCVESAAHEPGPGNPFAVLADLKLDE